MLHLLHDPLGIFGAVHFQEDFTNHGLLVRREIFSNTLLGDVPVVIHLGPERMVKREHHRLHLSLCQTLIQRGDQCF